MCVHAGRGESWVYSACAMSRALGVCRARRRVCGLRRPAWSWTGGACRESAHLVGRVVPANLTPALSSSPLELARQLVLRDLPRSPKFGKQCDGAIPPRLASRCASSARGALGASPCSS